MKVIAIVALVVVIAAMAEAGKKSTSSVRIQGKFMGNTKVNYRTRRQIPLLAGALPYTTLAAPQMMLGSTLAAPQMMLRSGLAAPWALPYAMPYAMPYVTAPVVTRTLPLPTPYGFDAYGPALEAMKGLEAKEEDKAEEDSTSTEVESA